MRPEQAPLDLPTVLRFSDLAVAALGEAREEIDALNVYPVPDGDTGTNLFLTFESARNAMREALEDPGDSEAGGDTEGSGPAGEQRTARALEAYARGALLGARGNSGVIMSQIVGAVCKRLATAGPADRAAVVFAEGMALATEASYAAVGRPVEGTILTVARAASEAATAAAAVPHQRLGQVIRAAASAAQRALERTPDQLPVLRDAGVVDAGGRGLCVVLDAIERAATGKRAVPVQAGLGRRAIPLPTLAPSGDLTEHGPSYEVMYLLEADDARIGELRSRLDRLGDSLVVVGGDGLWNVHVHVDDVGAAIEAGIEAGRPYRVRVTHFAEQAARRAGGDQAGARQGRKVVVLAAGDGLRRLFESAGAVVIDTGPGRRPSTGAILEAVLATGAEEVVVLPNEADSIAAAEAAARAAREVDGLRAAVIPTRGAVHGLAALAVHEPGRSFSDDVLEMTAAARHARSGAVTRASRRAMTSAGPCEPGDVLGAIEGDFVLVGDDPFTVAAGVIERLLGGGGELVTLVSGAEADDLADRCATYLASQYPTVDVVVYEGGQEHYPLLLAVE